MLSMTAGRSIEYYVHLAQEDYYTRGEEPLGVWVGKGHCFLGLAGKVLPEEFESLARALQSQLDVSVARLLK